MRELIRLLRVEQWYKNLLIVLPAFFALRLSTSIAVSLTVGFVALCLMSSATYIINDIVDRDVDKKHPQKKKRPLASGALSIGVGWILAILCLAGGIGISLWLSKGFAVITASLFILSQLYTFWLKHEAYADIIMISSNGVIRTYSGAVLAGVIASNWLLIGVFFFGLFLASAKRHSDLQSLKKKAVHHKASLGVYTLAITEQLMMMSATILIITYALYTFFREQESLVYTIPFALYCILQFYSQVLSGHKMGSQAHLAVTDKKLVISALLWLVITTAILYF
jgi:decaprenyl-phosphate phosphoribosyltransferase